MKFMKLPVLLSIALAHDVYANEAYDINASESQHILFLAHTGKLEACIDNYQGRVAQTLKHDMDFLEDLGVTILQQGVAHKDPEAVMLALFGAGISLNEKVQPLLSQALASSNPRMQLIALNFLTRWQDDYTDTYLTLALRSNYLLIRLQAAAKMAEWQHRQAVMQLESLMCKLDTELHAVLPQLFSIIHDTAASKALRKLLNSSAMDVRVEAIRCVAKAKRDDLLSKIRSMATHTKLAELEACCTALGMFQDEASFPQLQAYAASSDPYVRLAAAMSLYSLGRKEYVSVIIEMAKSGDLYAITALGMVEGGQDVLAELQNACDMQIRLNATLGLLEKRDPRCLRCLKDFLIKDHRDLGFLPQSSPGKSFHCLKAVPSATQNFNDSPTDHELSLSLREDILMQTIDLPEREFLSVVEMILSCRQNDLLATAMRLLEQKHSPEAITLLKKYQQCAGAPLLRNYCNLTLMRLDEEGPYKATLKEWVKSRFKESFIMRPENVKDLEPLASKHLMTPEESSRLLLETFQFFAEKHDTEGINILLDAIKSGHPNNRYALAGLLIRAAL